MKINANLIVLIIFLMLMIVVVAYGATIVGSKHDISTSGEEICVFCHTPHFSNAGLKPLWNRQTTTATFTPYSSPTMNTTCPATPNHRDPHDPREELFSGSLTQGVHCV